MPSLKEYNNKIGSMKNTAKVTKTMKMVATSKFRRAQDAQKSSKLYAQSLDALVSRVAAAAGTGANHPLLKPRTVKKVLVLVVAADKGLCGGFNNNLLKFVRNWSRQKTASGVQVSYAAIGKRAVSGCRRLGNLAHSFEELSTAGYANAQKVAETLAKDFLSGAYDEVYLANNLFKSALSQVPTLVPFIPVAPATGSAAAGATADYEYEPEAGTLIGQLLPRVLAFNVFSAMLENAAGEHAARMTAMDNATTNANNLIKHYTKLRNRARQAKITTELSEIVAGAESLK